MRYILTEIYISKFEPKVWILVESLNPGETIDSHRSAVMRFKVNFRLVGSIYFQQLFQKAFGSRFHFLRQASPPSFVQKVASTGSPKLKKLGRSSALIKAHSKKVVKIVISAIFRFSSKADLHPTGSANGLFYCSLKARLNYTFSKTWQWYLG